MPKSAAQIADDEALAKEIAEMTSRLEAPAAAGWRPEVGAVLTGKLVDIDTANAGGYGDYPLLLVADFKTGETTAVHCFHTVLRNAVEKKNPRVGDKVAIKFLGTEKTQDGSNEFSNYKLIVMPPVVAGEDIPF